MVFLWFILLFKTFCTGYRMEFVKSFFTSVSYLLTNFTSLLGSSGQEPKNREEWFEDLFQYPQGSKEFVDVFVKGEHLFLDEGNCTARVYEDGRNLEAKFGNFDDVYLFKSLDGMGLEYPNDLNFSGLPGYFEPRMIVYPVDTYSAKIGEMMASTFFKKLKEPMVNRKKALNLLSLEFFNMLPGLWDLCAVPPFFSRLCITQKVEEVLREEKRKLLSLKKSTKNVNLKLKSMPRHEKFILVSMAGSFTGVHVDFSAAGVLFHVVVGKKIFYVAPPTPENLKIYEHFTKNQPEDEFIIEQLADQWKRIEINGGETAMLPSGWLHFVYTPEDSISIGGNFLMEQFFQTQFDITKLEEATLHHHENDTHLFRGFWDIMYCYVEEILIPELKPGQPDPKILEYGEILLKNLNPSAEHTRKNDWYNRNEKTEILEKLRTILSSIPSASPSATQTTSSNSRPNKRLHNNRNGRGGPVQKKSKKH